MIKIIRPRERKERTDYSREFEWADCPGAGFSFPCDKQGNVNIDEMCDEAKGNLAGCLNGTMKSTSGAGVVDKGIREYVSKWIEPALAECICGHTIELAAFTNTCEKCGRDYNSSGQELAPRSQWGEDTGESLDEILSIGHHIS